MRINDWYMLKKTQNKRPEQAAPASDTWDIDKIYWYSRAENPR